MLVLSKNIGDGFLTFTPINRIWYINMTDSYTAFFSAVNSSPKVDVCTDVCLFDDHFFLFNPPWKESLLFTFLIPYHVHGIHIQKYLGLIYQIEVLGIFYRYLIGNMSTGFQNPSSALLSHNPYLCSGVAY